LEGFWAPLGISIVIGFVASLAMHKYKIEDRRRRVASLLALSMTESEIAEQLNNNQSSR